MSDEYDIQQTIQTYFDGMYESSAEKTRAAFRRNATISQLTVEFGIHRTTVTGHLDRHGVPRHSEVTA